MRFSLKHLLTGLIFSLFAFNAQATMIASSSFDGHHSGGTTITSTWHYDGGYDVWSAPQTYGFNNWSDAANWWHTQSRWPDALDQIFGHGTNGWLADIFKWKLCYFGDCCPIGDNPGQPTEPTDAPTGPADPDTPSADVPAPGSSMALLAMGLVGLMAWTRRRRWQDNDAT